MFKFGDKVVVTKPGFYEGAKGTVIYNSKADGSFSVSLTSAAGAIHRDFYPSELKKEVRRKPGVGK